jgi:uridine kinase
LARAILERSPGGCVVELDWYYHDLSHLPSVERARWNFDHPDALDWDLLLEQLGRLTAGEAIGPPVYDFRSHTRAGRAPEVGPAPLIVLEGILALHNEEVRKSLDLGIFISTTEPVRLARRLERDIRERGRTAESVHEQFERTVRPMHLAFVEPTRAHARLVADGEASFGPTVDQAMALLEPGA